MEQHAFILSECSSTVLRWSWSELIIVQTRFCPIRSHKKNFGSWSSPIFFKTRAQWKSFSGLLKTQFVFANLSFSLIPTYMLSRFVYHWVSSKFYRLNRKLYLSNVQRTRWLYSEYLTGPKRVLSLQILLSLKLTTSMTRCVSLKVVQMFPRVAQIIETENLTYNDPF